MNAAALSWCFSLSPAFSIQACGKTRCGRQCSSYLIKGTANSARGWTARRVRSARGLRNIKHKTREEGRRINGMDDDTKARTQKAKKKSLKFGLPALFPSSLGPQRKDFAGEIREREKETSKESLEVGQKRTTLYLSPILSNCLIDNFSQDYNFSLGGWAKTVSVQPFASV